MAEENPEIAKARNETKIKRRTAKAALTRTSKAVRYKLDENRPAQEVLDAFNILKLAYDDLISKHEQYTQLIEDDDAFENEEKWVEECQNIYLHLEMLSKDYVNKAGKKGNLVSVPESGSSGESSTAYQENSVTETAQDQEGTQINETVEQISNTENSVSGGETNNHETTDGNAN